MSDLVVVLWGEMKCWSLQEFKGLKTQISTWKTTEYLEILLSWKPSIHIRNLNESSKASIWGLAPSPASSCSPQASLRSFEKVLEAERRSVGEEERKLPPPNELLKDN